MNIAIASGKGGTGKTTIATNLAFVASQQGQTVSYLDCDVEAPNGDIFLKPTVENDEPIFVKVPKVDETKCIACGQCEAICQFSAIVVMNKTVLTFPDLCHSCGGCWEVCPFGAITQGREEIGRLQQGKAGSIEFCQGRLKIGTMMSPPVIHAVKAASDKSDITIVDCPPGTSCPVIESVRNTDYVVLVTEPTPFGLNDLKLAVKAMRKLQLPFGVVINRANMGDSKTRDYCRDQGIPILSQIPDLRPVAEAYSRGELLSAVSESYRFGIERLLERIRQETTR
ncbi:MAG: P-loop NTPase [Phycisphaerales bacterium]|jgi:MinD superfamily P-loop ATPase|nr:P-loop NTPase [Phycisphaerales bacterium]MBT7172010.1 P-loop NTPase [Phycisphaerales bacterium]